MIEIKATDITTKKICNKCQACFEEYCSEDHTLKNCIQHLANTIDSLEYDIKRLEKRIEEAEEDVRLKQ